MKLSTRLGLAAMAFASTSMAAYAAQPPIRIGAIISATGPATFLGDPELKTLKLYVDKINQEGGVLDRKLELIDYDDGSDASKANSFAKRLIYDDKVDAMIVGTTGSTMAAIPLAQKAHVPLMSLGGAIAITEPVKKWVFKTPQTDRMAAEKVFQDMKNRGITQIALLSEASGFGQSGKKESEAIAGKYGISIIENEVYNPKDTDMSPQLTKIRGDAKVQAVFIFGLGQGPVIATRNYRQLGIKQPLYQSHGVASDQFIKLAGDAANGVRLPSPALIVADQLPGNDAQKPVVNAYIQAYKARYNENVSTFGSYAYDGLTILVDALKRAGSTDKDKFRDAIESTHGYVGTTGVFNITAKDHTGLDLSAFKLLEIQNGQWKLLD
ncbi:MAG: ABC transporter substrate-binding protein [Castellaniella sp.]|uniref:ABC transporter substrate-binding protein n=1 Tax=Castellaniella sp. TaxID=1955812 RepID=UPI0011F5D125|nr:ABC transporter substrate-binding protein [Castellaniella sp.]TAN28045.1 MAG: ABC transporter substrate-binding protein [Castellaniella sp.]